jgi:single-stranded DNA-binding protein
MNQDLNLVCLRGRLATDPEPRLFDSGSRLIRYLVTVRADAPKRRVDVVPVTIWDPEERLWDAPGVKGDTFWVCGSVQRRFWESPDGRRSRVEIVAEEIHLRAAEALEEAAVDA